MSYYNSLSEIKFKRKWGYYEAGADSVISFSIKIINEKTVPYE